VSFPNLPDQILCTIGDPSSIGPEVFLKSAVHFMDQNQGGFLRVYAPENILEQTNSALLSKLKESKRLQIVDLDSDTMYSAGKKSTQSAARALKDLEAAILDCLSNQIPALVTGPVDKSLCAKVLPSFRGQTEFLLEKTKSESVCMLMQSSEMRVALVTNHLPLRKVADSVTTSLIVLKAKLLHAYLSSWTKEPKIAICALNPHASDSGLLGDEEEKIIIPAIEQLQKAGMQCSGPHPADTLFSKASLYDGILAMYHDQALIPIKTRGFFEAINISLGLPFLRTSVDHGTAFDLVGKNEASYLSYQNALKAALEWSKRKNESSHS
jgi:4-hydroxythreonine-4-phosphate dehydrogenase